MPETKQRMPWMDLLRGIAVVLVVVFHVGNGNGPGAPEPVRTFNETVGDYRLVALFLASGLLLDRSLAKGSARYFSGKLRMIVWPYLIWTGLIMLPFMHVTRGLEPDLAWWFWPKGSHTWFLSTLAAIYLVGFLARFIRPVWLALGLLAASQLIDRGAFELGVYAYSVAWYGFFFFVGVMLARHVDAVVNAPVWAFAIGAGLTAVWSATDLIPVPPPAARPLLAAVMTAIGVWTFVWVLARLPRVGPLRLFEWLGRRSIVTFLVHVLVLRTAIIYLEWPRDDWTGFLSLLATVLLVCILATRYYSRIRWLFEWPIPPRSRRPAEQTDPQVPVALTDRQVPASSRRP